jgi:hypothetical protein
MRLSKAFYLGSIAGGLGLGVLVLLITVVLMVGLGGNISEDEAALAIVPAMLFVFYGGVVMMVLWYKMWAAIQDGHARATPGKAIGFLFIPFFNLYWAFQAIWGWAKDYNAYTARHGLANAPKMPEGLFLLYVIFCFTTWIPILGMLLLVANFVIAIIMVGKICDGVNALPATPPAAA